MPRITIKRLMILVAVAAIVLWGCRNHRRMLPIAVFSLGSLAGTGFVWWVACHHPRLAFWMFAIAGPLTNASFALICAFLYDTGGLGLMLLATLTMIPLVLGCGAAWAMAGDPARRISDRVARVVVLVVGLMPVSMMITLWPLRIAFAISRPAIDRLADRVAAGEVVPLPISAGLYEIVLVRVEPSNGNIALIIDASPSGMSGFVRKGGDPEGFGPMHNLNFDEPVGVLWRYQNED